MKRHHILLWSHKTRSSCGNRGEIWNKLIFYDRNMLFHLGLTLPLWGRICKWNTNELKVFSLWGLINQGAPLLHIYIFLKSSRSSPVTNYSAFPGQLHWTSAPLCSAEHHTCIFAPFIFSRVLQAEGYSRERTTGEHGGSQRARATVGPESGVLHRWGTQKLGRFNKRWKNAQKRLFMKLKVTY